LQLREGEQQPHARGPYTRWPHSSKLQGYRCTQRRPTLNSGCIVSRYSACLLPVPHGASSQQGAAGRRPEPRVLSPAPPVCPCAVRFGRLRLWLSARLSVLHCCRVSRPPPLNPCPLLPARRSCRSLSAVPVACWTVASQIFVGCWKAGEERERERERERGGMGRGCRCACVLLPLVPCAKVACLCSRRQRRQRRQLNGHSSQAEQGRQPGWGEGGHVARRCSTHASSSCAVVHAAAAVD
jgi:hypothetical protein